MWSIFDAQTIIKPVTFRHMHFPGRKTYVSVVEKVHFQKSDILPMSKRKVLRFFTWRAQSNHIAPQDPSENDHFGVEIHDVFENVPVAGTFLAFLSSPNHGNACIYF